jgi:uncharacterized membrane protein (UPF0127 family)
MLVLLVAGCEKPGVSGSPTQAVPTNAHLPYLNHAQPRLPSITLWIGSKEVEAELALTETQVSTGMMYRQTMAPNEGMLFVFPRPHKTAFYMRNTVIPLSASYIDAEGKLLEIHDLKPLDETPVHAATATIQYVLETPQGWFKKNNIEIGTLIRSEHGSLQETFFRKNRP